MGTEAVLHAAPVQTGGQSAKSDGCGSLGKRCERRSASGGCADWTLRLQHLCQLDVKGADDIAQAPLKIIGQSPVRGGDVTVPKDAFGLQYNIVRVDGTRAVYLPIFKQGGDSNTIAIVNSVETTLKKLYDVPPTLETKAVFDQSRFVKTAIETLVHEGGIGLFLTCLMILIFLGSMRATLAVFFSIPLSVLATFLVLHLAGSSINTAWY
jgi:multidrug efflux pump subunit AcrB